MPGRIKILVGIYLIVVLGLTSLMVYESESSVVAKLLYGAYFAAAPLLGFWAALGKSSLKRRIAGSALPGLGLATAPAAYSFVVLFQGNSGMFLFSSEILILMIKSFGMSALMTCATFLTPVLLGTAAGWIGRCRGLHAECLVLTSNSRGETRFSLSQLLCLTFVAAVALGIQSLLAAGARNNATMSETSTSYIPYLISFACQVMGGLMPLALLSAVSIWTVLFLDSPWRRMIWGAPTAMLCGALSWFYDTIEFGALFWVAVLYAVQVAVLWVVRSAGYRLVRHPLDASAATELLIDCPVIEPIAT